MEEARPALYTRVVDARETTVELCRRLERQPRICAAYLYGSFARGTATSASDVDLAVLFETTPIGYLAQPFDLEAELSEAIGKTVQIVVLDTAPPDLVHRVLRDGRILLDRNPARRIAFEVRAR